jgi:hypothetical protein
MDRRIDRVTRDSQGNQGGYSGQREGQVTQDRRGNQDGDSGQQAD